MVERTLDDARRWVLAGGQLPSLGWADQTVEHGPLFCSASPFIDDVLWSEPTRDGHRLSGLASDRVVETLLDAGAERATWPINLPAYQSWAKLKLSPIEGIRLHRDEQTITYVPTNDFSIATDRSTIFEWRIDAAACSSMIGEAEAALAARIGRWGVRTRLGRLDRADARELRMLDRLVDAGQHTVRVEAPNERVARQSVRDDLDRWCLERIERGWPAEIRNEPVERRQLIAQWGPRSERGQLTVEAADVEGCLTWLSKAGLPVDLHRRVPYRLWYDDEPDHRPIPLLSAYASDPATWQECFDTWRQNNLGEPIHGLTGTAAAEAPQHLRRIVTSGGLKSNWLRRREGIAVRTSSPIGDIASGIDHGIPLCLGTQPPIGQDSAVAIVADLRVLAVRDAWCAPRDFGGGYDRYLSYCAYHRSINNCGGPLSHESRLAHLRGSLRSDNEWFVPYELPITWWSRLATDSEQEDQERIKRKLDSAAPALYRPADAADVTYWRQSLVGLDAARRARGLAAQAARRGEQLVRAPHDRAALAAIRIKERAKRWLRHNG